MQHKPLFECTELILRIDNVDKRPIIHQPFGKKTHPGRGTRTKQDFVLILSCGKFKSLIQYVSFEDSQRVCILCSILRYGGEKQQMWDNNVIM